MDPGASPWTAATISTWRTVITTGCCTFRTRARRRTEKQRRRFMGRTAVSPPAQLTLGGGPSANSLSAPGSVAVTDVNGSDNLYVADTLNSRVLEYIALNAQTITFGTAPSPAIENTSVTVSASGGGSGNPVIFTSATTGVCTTSGTNGATVALIAVGTCQINADQAGNTDYAAAAQVSQSFTVTAPPTSYVAPATP